MRVVVRRRNRSSGRPRVVTALALAGALLGGALLTGCGGGDHGPQLLPIAKELRAQPGVATVDDFYVPQQLKVAEAYEADVRMTWHATASQTCSLIPTFFAAVGAIGIDSGSLAMSVRHAGPAEVYPYRWMYQVDANDLDPTELEQVCMRLQPLRDLPPGATVDAFQSGVRTQARINVPAASVADEAAARQLVADLVGIDVEDLTKPEESGFDLRVDLTQE